MVLMIFSQTQRISSESLNRMFVRSQLTDSSCLHFPMTLTPNSQDTTGSAAANTASLIWRRFSMKFCMGQTEDACYQTEEDEGREDDEDGVQGEKPADWLVVLQGGGS